VIPESYHHLAGDQPIAFISIPRAVIARWRNVTASSSTMAKRPLIETDDDLTDWYEDDDVVTHQHDEVRKFNYTDDTQYITG
jgi:hypothetical protein